MASSLLTAPVPATGVTYYTETPSPIGPLSLTSDGQALTRLYMYDGAAADAADPWRAWGLGVRAGTWIAEAGAAPFPAVRDQLAADFAGRLTVFDLPLALHGTAFQQRVWAALQTIPYGTTTTYGHLARTLGQPTGSRAVGLANGRNPVSIIVPCHRVIGASGSLTGYGGGLERKRFLLELEAGVPSLLA